MTNSGQGNWIAAHCLSANCSTHMARPAMYKLKLQNLINKKLDGLQWKTINWYISAKKCIFGKCRLWH